MAKSDKRSSRKAPNVQQPPSSTGFPFRLVIAGIAIIVSLVAAVRNDGNWDLPALRDRLLDALAPESDADFALNPEVCPQYDAILPDAYAGLLSEVDEKIASEAWTEELLETFGGVLQFPTITVPDTVPFDDPAYAPFSGLHAYLEKKFPLIHAQLRKTLVNHFGLVFHWQGESATLKPILLTGHQDVVPVAEDTADQWKYPPFDGRNDGKWVYGRGTVDCKSVIISHLAAVEILLEKGFKPKRTVVLAYGFDEETGGFLGAVSMSRYMEETYGRDSFSLLIDEAYPSDSPEDVIIVAPSPAEKGIHLSRIEISIPGGHSAEAPPHNSIEMMAAYIMELETKRPPIRLIRGSPYYERLLCEAKFDTSMPAHLAALVKRSRRSDSALNALVAELFMSDNKFPGIASTMQGISTIHGGSYAGQVPENVAIVVGYLVASYDSVASVDARLTALAEPLLDKYNLSLDVFGKPVGNIEKGHGFGHMSMHREWKITHDPPPVSPIFGSGAWMYLAGTIKSVLATSNNIEIRGKPAVVAPTLCLGGSDAIHYQQLTRSIYRYIHVVAKDQRGIHTVDESIRTSAVFEMVRFAARLIVNSDSSLLELDDN